MEKRELFKLEGDKIVRLRRNCPRCGTGVFLAEHKDRLSCGSCGYTEFKAKKEQIQQTAVAPVEKKQPQHQKPVEKPHHPPQETAKPKPVEKHHPPAQQ